MLRNDRLNQYIAKFFLPLLHHAMASLNWGGNGATLGRLRKKKIIVPVTGDGAPDYDFMEQYIKEREEKMIAEYMVYSETGKGDIETEAGKMSSLLDREWKAFNLIGEGMFYIDEVKTFKSTALVESSGVFDIVGATSRNNGNVGFLPKQYEDYLTDGNCICLIKTGQGAVGDAVYKQGAFIPSNNVCVIRSPWLNRYSGMFIAAEINKQADRYSYGYIRSNSRIRKEQLMLPTADGRTPDYAFMEMYIREREKRSLEKYMVYVGASRR